MITNNPMQLKAFIKKMSTEKNISAQLIMQNYMMERFLERISLSKYKVNFILQRPEFVTKKQKKLRNLLNYKVS